MAFRRLVFCFWLFLVASIVRAQTPPPNSFRVLTERYDNLRSGANLQESVLRPETLAPDPQGKKRFGKLFERSVDGPIYAQPLYLSNVLVPGKGRRNLVFVATANNTVFAFDADSCSGPDSLPLWARNLGPAVSSSLYDVSATFPLAYALKVTLRLPLAREFAALLDTIRVPCLAEFQQSSPRIGIVSTPTIDPKKGLLYVVSVTTRSERGKSLYQHRIFALAAATGAVVHGPATIAGSVRGSGDGSVNGKLEFDSYYHFQQSALLLDRGILYVAFGSHDDLPCAGPTFANSFRSNAYGMLENFRDYAGTHGWVFAYDARTLTRLGLVCTSPNSITTDPRIEDLLHLRLANTVAAGVGMGGVGPAADEAGNVYVATGKGIFDREDAPAGTPPGTEFGNSLLRLGWVRQGTERPHLGIVDFFTPSDQKKISQAVPPVGAAGVVLLPRTADSKRPILTTALGSSLYVLDRGHLGGFVPPAPPPDASAEPEAGSPGTPPGSPEPGASATTTTPPVPTPLDAPKAYPRVTEATTPVYWQRSPDPAWIYCWSKNNNLEAWSLDGQALKSVASLPPGSDEQETGPPFLNLTLSANGSDAGSGILWAASPDPVLPGRQVGGIVRAFAAGVFDTANGQSTFRPLWSSNDDPTGVDAPGDVGKFTAPMVTGGKVFLPSLSGTLCVYAPLSDRQTVPATAAITIDSDHPNDNLERDPRLMTQTDAKGGIRYASLLRFIVPDFTTDHAPASVFLTLRPHPGMGRPDRASRQINLVVAGVEGAGIWQPSQITWSNAPGNRPGSSILSLPGASHPVLLMPRPSRSEPPPVTFDITDFIRSRPGQPVTLFLVSIGQEPLAFQSRGPNAPFLTLNWK